MSSTFETWQNHLRDLDIPARRSSPKATYRDLGIDSLTSWNCIAIEQGVGIKLPLDAA